jgi:hypothetical protein
MQRGIGAWVCFVVGALLANGSMAADPAAPEYLAPEYFFSRERYADFLPHARQFLADHPRDERAPRIVMDRIMVATLLQNQAELKDAKLQLLLDHPQTVPNGYFLRTTPVNDLKGLLKDAFHSHQPLTPVILEKYTRAFDACYRMHGPSLVDDELMAQMALATREPRVAAQCQASIKKADSEPAKLVAIALNAKLQPIEKLQQLQALRHNKTAQAYQRYLYDVVLSDADRAAPAAQSIVVENLLHDKHFADALPKVAELSAATKNPQHVFWLAWAQMATGEPGAARATLADLAREHADSPWAKVGGELEPLVENLHANLADHVDATEDALAKLVASPPELIEATIAWKANAGQPNRLYAGLDLGQDALEVIAFADAKALVAYRAALDDCRLYVAGDAAINRYRSRGMCPTFNFAADAQESGGYRYNMNFNTVQQGSGGLVRSVRSLLTLPWLKTKQSRESFITHAARSGYLPLPVETAGGETILRWVAPQVDRAELVRSEVRLDAEQRLTSISGDGWSVRDIRYGTRDEVRLKPPAWPAVPVQEVAEFGASDMMRLFTLAMTLLNEKKEAENVAAEKTPAKR